ncbi:hypothetical protein BJ944DRAFT_157798 [Cunninghamella echinulata]|nr:hypothetical protein BJ944DRAFT_157798 [Cunninghamella echinulata]
MTTLETLQKENEALKQKVALLEAQLLEKSNHNQNDILSQDLFEQVTALTNPDIRRFGRQLILPNSILIVGAGGLGAPAALYLGAGGVGRLGIVDHDEVDIGNLHRQVIHTEAKQGINKAISAMMSIKAINSSCHVVPYTFALESSNALEVIQEYDLVVDATDNVATRYLLNDACVLLGKPLVSGSALRYDGQLTVYNYKNGPCYRCLHPVPPPPETVGRCSDNGVLGVAGEPSFLIFSALSNPIFRTMKLRNKKNNCDICSEQPKITKLIDYVEFCGSGADDKNTSQSILKPDERITPMEYKNITEQGKPHILIDVRPTLQLDICKLPHSLDIPIDELEKRIDEVNQRMEQNTLQGKDGKIIIYIYVNLNMITIKMFFS